MKKTYKLFLLLIFTIFMFVPFVVHADGESRVQVIFTDVGGTFTFQTTSDLDEEVNSATKQKMVPIGETVTLVATASDTHTFEGWYPAEEVDISGGHGIMGWQPVENAPALTTNATYSFTVTDLFYNIMPVFESKGGHNNIWVTAGGEIAVLYENRAPEQEMLDGEHWADSGIIVDYMKGDSITVKARAIEGYHFLGWFQTDPAASVPENYVREPVISTSTTYTYQPSRTTITGIDEPINYITAAFELDDDSNKETYTVVNTEIGATVIFPFNEGHDFVLNMYDLLTLTDEEREAVTGYPPEQFEEALEAIKETMKEYGDLLSVYVITIDDGAISYSDAVTLKLALTEAMKKYNTLKLVYLDENNNFQVGDIKEFSINSETADADLDHLSVYALVGSNTSDNPGTKDTIYINFILFIICSLIFGTTTYTTFKRCHE